MRGVYTSGIKISGLSAAKTLIYITAPSGKAIEILGAKIGNAPTNGTNQQLEALLQRVSSLGSPTGTAITPTPHEKGDQAAGATVVGNVTANEPAYATGAIWDQQGFASLAGYQHCPLPEERVIVQPGDTVGLRMISTPVAFDCVVTLTHREIG
jgi:hypothetical protein